jgi:3-deoxy-manno-octulosonate cytidylyltransferase (CMP-KDO synthetase)
MPASGIAGCINKSKASLKINISGEFRQKIVINFYLPQSKNTIMKKKAIAIIPCRYGSSRFPGKPLALLGGYPLMWHPYDVAIKSGLFKKTYIATDSKLITDKCEELRINFILTKENHITGTDRIAECVDLIKEDFDCIVNIQGDEPFITKNDLLRLLDASSDNNYAVNGYSKITSISEIMNHGVVKMTISGTNRVIGLSRSPIPYINNKGSLVVYKRQSGLYLLHKNHLDVFRQKKQGPLEECEGIEMLRLLENDMEILGVEITNQGVAVDTESDLVIAKKWWEKQNGK